jgi:hypothetical protein
MSQWRALGGKHVFSRVLLSRYIAPFKGASDDLQSRTIYVRGLALAIISCMEEERRERFRALRKAQKSPVRARQHSPLFHLTWQLFWPPSVSNPANVGGEQKMSTRAFTSFLFMVSSAALVFAATPVVIITSPVNGDSIGSPVNYVASASSDGCQKVKAAMRIYTAPAVNAYTINSSSLNTNINLPTGTYNTVVQAWDKCGGVGMKQVRVTIAKSVSLRRNSYTQPNIRQGE